MAVEQLLPGEGYLGPRCIWALSSQKAGRWIPGHLLCPLLLRNPLCLVSEQPPCSFSQLKDPPEVPRRDTTRLLH